MSLIKLSEWRALRGDSYGIATFFVVIVIQTGTLMPAGNARAAATPFALTAMRPLDIDDSGGDSIKVKKSNRNQITASSPEFIRGIQNPRVGSSMNSIINIQNAICKTKRHACKIVLKIQTPE
jgi:hypothetical protein